MAEVRRACDFCHREYIAKRARSRFCSDNCRVRFSQCRARGDVVHLPERRKPQQATQAAPRPVIPAVGVEASTRTLLESSGLVDVPLGQLAVGLAQRIDSAVAAGESGSALAAMARELRSTLAEVTRAAQTASDPIDELRRRREARLRPPRRHDRGMVGERGDESEN